MAHVRYAVLIEASKYLNVDPNEIQCGSKTRVNFTQCRLIFAFKADYSNKKQKNTLPQKN
jgi:hypothetical protein